jgi:hypothetical protein
MIKFTNRTVRNIANKTNKKVERTFQKEVKALIRTLKADIKRTSKKGITDFRCKIRNIETYEKAKYYFISKGFRCWEYSSEDLTGNTDKYLAITW